MPPASPLFRDGERVAALQRYGFMGTTPEPSFDEIAAVAARACATPFALIAFVDHELQWFKGMHGLAVAAQPRELAFGVDRLMQPASRSLVADALHDPGLACHPWVVGPPGIRAGAGEPLCTAEGWVIGTLWVLDRVVRAFTAAQQETLGVLGRQVMVQLELRRARHQAELDAARLANSQRIAHLGDWDHDFGSKRLLWSEEIYRILGIARSGQPPDSQLFYQMVHPEDATLVRREKAAASEGVRQVDFEHRIVRPDGEVRYIHQVTEMIFDDEGFPARESGVVQDITDRKKSEEELRRSEERYRLLTESVPLGICECDALGEVIYNNGALTALTGRPVEDSLGTGWVNTVHPADRVATATAWAQVVRDGTRWDEKHRLQRPDGSVRWVHAVGSPRRDAAGRIAGFVGTIRNITEQHEAEAVVLENEERYRQMLTLSPDALYVHVDGIITFANEACCRLLGFANAAELLGRSALDLVHPADHATVRELRRRHAEDGTTATSEMRFVRRDGTAVDVEANSVAFEFHGHSEVQVIARDVTARRQAVTALRQSEERFKFVARAVSDVVWDWDLVARTLWWNDGFLTTFGFAAHEVDPSMEFWTSRIHPDDRARVVGSIEEILANGREIWKAEYRFGRKDGSYAFVQDRGYILRNAAGTALRMVGGMRDLTESRKMEEQFLRAQRMDSIGTLAGGIAHDLNNVLAPIMMAIELLKQDAGGNPRRSQMLETMHVSCRHGADLVRQVLSFARGVDGQRVTIALELPLGELEGIVRQTFPRNIAVVREVAPDLWPITGDPSQIYQVLLNLAVNARDAMPQGGQLTLAADNVVEPAGAPGAAPGRYIRLRIADTGLGIPPEVRDRIFEPFFTTKEVGKGTGLGLATVHTVVKTHGGFVSLESEVGVGTTFSLYFPADPSLTPLPPLPPASELPRGQGEMILVVDDEFAIRHIMEHTLQAFGYRVLTASDGAEGVKLYARRQAEIALVVTDMMMPVMDGNAMIRALSELNPGVRIIAASGLTDPTNPQEVRPVQVKYFLPKPYTAAALLEVIRQVLAAPAS